MDMENNILDETVTAEEQEYLRLLNLSESSESDEVLIPFDADATKKNKQQTQITQISKKCRVVEEGAKTKPQGLNIKRRTSKLVGDKGIRIEDLLLPYKVYSCAGELEMEYLQIDKIAMLGQGSQGKVFEVEILGLEGHYVDKI